MVFCIRPLTASWLKIMQLTMSCRERSHKPTWVWTQTTWRHGKFSSVGTTWKTTQKNVLYIYIYTIRCSKLQKFGCGICGIRGWVKTCHFAIQNLWNCMKLRESTSIDQLWLLARKVPGSGCWKATNHRLDDDHINYTYNYNWDISTAYMITGIYIRIMKSYTYTYIYISIYNYIYVIGATSLFIILYI